MGMRPQSIMTWHHTLAADWSAVHPWCKVPVSPHARCALILLGTATEDAYTVIKEWLWSAATLTVVWSQFEWPTYFIMHIIQVLCLSDAIQVTRPSRNTTLHRISTHLAFRGLFVQLLYTQAELMDHESVSLPSWLRLFHHFNPLYCKYTKFFFSSVF